MKTQAILAAAGLGARLRQKLPKALVPLKQKPLFIYAAQVLERSPLIQSVIIVAPADFLVDFAGFVWKYHLRKVRRVISGGQTRCQSVSQGLIELDDDTDLVLIHDAARPLLSTKMVSQTIRTCHDVAGVIMAVPVKPTIKRVSKGMLVQATLKRDELWEVQTPQVFSKKILLQAYQHLKDWNTTDDAGVVEKLGKKVKVVPGDYHNIKVTTVDDIVLAEQFLKRDEK
jgi:2-C-methyl-D-erythritol 4-phosphate cytidylyltransferase